MSVGTKLLQAAAGNAGDTVYVDDVFSTTLYTGTDGSVVVPTGLDLSDKGGMIWGKSRSASQNHRIYDSVRGTQYSLIPNATSAQSDQGTQTFGSSSVTLGAASGIVGSSSYGGPDYVLWSFAKQEKFFDIVTYTGTGSSHNISHNLNTTPGMVIVKRTDSTADWYVWHRNGGDYASLNGAYAYLNADDQFRTGGGTPVFVDAGMTSTTFGVGTSSGTNANGGSYVAYLFGHNDAAYGEDSDEVIIKCGAFSAGSSAFVENLGFEPQFLIVKKDNGSGSFFMIDNMRGSSVDKNGDASSRRIATDQNSAEGGESYSFGIASNGIGVEIADGNTYIYMAIRRSHKPASEFTATDLFTLQAQSPGEGADTFISTGFNVDTVIYRSRASSATSIGDRLRGQSGGGDFLTNSTDAEGTNAGAFFLDHSNGVTVDYAGGHFNISPAATDKNYIRYFLRRAKGFFDVVSYTGDGTSTSFSHNLGSTPELKIIKIRSDAFGWLVGGSAITGGTTDYQLYLDTNAAQANTNYWGSVDSASAFSVVASNFLSNANGQTYIAYLFATVAGISKVGSYTGTGSDLNVDCGFSSGARFVLIKRTDSTGDWYLYDSARGIVAGNDPYVFLNATDAEVTNTDYIDPLSSGFTVTSSAPAGLNASSGTYIFLAIAQDLTWQNIETGLAAR